MQMPDISSSLAVGGIPMPQIGNIGSSASKETTAGTEGRVEFPGEFVCAVQFRKVQFSSSGIAEKRWIALFWKKAAGG
jgi:hypothetical protein